MFGFVGYQLWGTGIEYAQAQDELDSEFEQLIASASTVDDPAASAPVTSVPDSSAPVDGASPGTVATAAPPTTTPPPTTFIGAPAPVVPAAPGEVVGRIEMPTIGVDANVVEGVAREDLKRAPGHYPDTPLPGQLGNASIAGHRSTYGAPFAELDELEIGDRIIVTTVQGRFVYLMTAVDIVSPSAAGVIATTDPNVARLTLTTCHPEYSAQQRLIIYADLDIASSAPPQDFVPPPVEPSPDLAGEDVAAPPADPAEPPASAEPVTTATDPVGAAAPADGGEVSEDAADAFAQGWFSDEAAFTQVALWGSALAGIGLGAFALSWWLRRNWIGALAGIVPFLVVAYFFFQNVNRLLPAAL